MASSINYRFDPWAISNDEQIEVMIPIPVSDGYQEITDLQLHSPADIDCDTRGNQIGFLRATNPRNRRVIDWFVPPILYRSEIGFRAKWKASPFILGKSRLNLPEPTEGDLTEAPLIPITDEIRDLAKQLTEGLSDNEARARALYRFCSATLTYRYPPRQRGAAQSLKAREGDCGEYAFLFCALCRAVHIPARPVLGWIVARWFRSPHAWAEVWLEEYGWVPVDPNLGREYRYFAPLLNVPAEPEFFFGNLDGYRLVLSRGTGLPWPGKVADAAAEPITSLVMNVDGRPFPWWQSLMNGTVPFLQLAYGLVRKPLYVPKLFEPFRMAGTFRLSVDSPWGVSPTLAAFLSEPKWYWLLCLSFLISGSVPWLAAIVCAVTIAGYLRSLLLPRGASHRRNVVVTAVWLTLVWGAFVGWQIMKVS